jgi:pyruvate/2-oxoglutarate/acetoin dehydrogenase E1 component
MPNEKYMKITYARGILDAHRYLLSNYSNVFVIGQGLWSPWYVGATMTDLDTDFGKNRIIDTPVSELATTGAAVGAAIAGYKPIVVHPRMDFMVLAIDQIVSQAAKWRHMFGGESSAPITIRAIINRGGEQGAQHSQALHSWFAHVPGLRVVMPATPKDARDLLIAAVLSNDPVMYLDDRWLYEQEEEVEEIIELNLEELGPKIVKEGTSCTIVGAGFTTKLCIDATKDLAKLGIEGEVIDMRILNPIRYDDIVASVEKTGHLCVVDGGWQTCGLAGEIIAGVVEKINLKKLKSSPIRITIPDAPAPTSRVLEDIYYIKSEEIVFKIQNQLKNA